MISLQKWLSEHVLGNNSKVESLQFLDLQWLASLFIANTTNAHLGQIELTFVF